MRRGAVTSEKRRKRRKKAKAAPCDANAYTAADPQLEEEKNPGKFDVSFQPPLSPSTAQFRDREVEFDSEKDDEEIDEELAFAPEDAKQFSHLFNKDDEEKALDCDLIQTVDNPDEVDELFGSDEELEEISGSEEEEEDTAQHEKLRAAVIGEPSKEKARRRVQTESRPEGVINITREEGTHLQSLQFRAKSVDVGSRERISDLANGVGQVQSSLRNVRKSLEVLEKQDVLTAPLPKRIQDRQVRRAGYGHAVKSLSKWDDLVFANRMAPTLEFVPPGAGLERPRTLEDMADGFEPESQMEREIADILKASGAQTEEGIVRMEDEHALKTMSLEELKKKRGQLAKMRSLLFHHEIKAKHIKKIKSKEYHRRLQRAIRKKAVRFGGLDSEEAAKKMLEDMAYSRMKERLTQKHSTMNRFARRIMRRGWGVADEQTKQALEEQLRQNQELKQKIKSTEEDASEDEPSSSSESDEEGQPEFKKTRKALLKVLNGAEDPDAAPKKGLIGLPFMQKALQKQRAKTQSEATKMLHTLDGTKEAAEKKIQSSRMQFKGKIVRNSDSGSESEEGDVPCVSHPPQAVSKQQQKHSEVSLGNSEGQRKHRKEAKKDHTTASTDTHRSFLFRKNKLKGEDDSENQKERPSSEHNDQTHSRPIQSVYVEEQPTSSLQVERPAEKDARESGAHRNSDQQVTGIPQSELIKLAFADDDVHDEFLEEKEAEVSLELPKIEDVSLLPGWGRWKDEQREPKWMQEKREKTQRMREKAVQKRKDTKKPFVFVSEKANEHLDKYKVTTIPPGFSSAEAYKASIRHPLGPDFNTSSAFEDFIRPKVQKRKGVIIEPLKLSHSAKDIREHVKEAKAGTVKVRKISSGEVKGQVQLAQ